MWVRAEDRSDARVRVRHATVAVAITPPPAIVSPILGGRESVLRPHTRKEWYIGACSSGSSSGPVMVMPRQILRKYRSAGRWWTASATRMGWRHRGGQLKRAISAWAWAKSIIVGGNRQWAAEGDWNEAAKLPRLFLRSGSRSPHSPASPRKAGEVVESARSANHRVALRQTTEALGGSKPAVDEC